MKKAILAALLSAALTLGAMPAVFSAENAAEAVQNENVGAYSTEAAALPQTDEYEAEIITPDPTSPSETAPEASAPAEDKKETYPVVTNIIAVDRGFKINWNRLDGAAKYRVFVKNGSRWRALGDTSALTYTTSGMSNNQGYTFTVRALDSNGEYASGYYGDGWTAINLNSPVISSAKSVIGGVRISWGKVSGAEKYRVFSKTRGGSWTVLADTDGTAFTDASTRSGVTYSYTVRCISADLSRYTSYFNSGKTLTYVQAPKITRIDNVNEGAKITWEKTAGAYSYRVFVKNGSSWDRVGASTSDSLIDKNAKGNRSYTYTVRAMDSAGEYVSDYYGAGWSNTFLTAPVLRSAESTFGGVSLSWSKVDGAEKYRVFVRDGSSWKHVAETTSTSYTDKNVKSGKTYTYTVRCISADLNKYTSGYNSGGITVKYLDIPTITGFENLANGAKISWSAVAGAAKYRVYAKTSSGWSNLQTTTSTTYVDTAAKHGETRIYTVRALNRSNSFITGYHPGGWSNVFLAPPSITSVSGSEGKTVLTWKADSAVSGWRVYRKSFGGSWEIIANTYDHSYTDNSAPKNTPITYTIRCLNSKGKLVSYYIGDTPYYVNGKIADGKVSVNGTSYVFSNGKLRQGLVTINGASYFYNSEGVLEKNGVVGNGTYGYYYADKNGKIDFSFTGIASNSKGYWYCRNGRVDFTARTGITYGGKDWIVLSGKAAVASSESEKTFFRALKLVDRITDSSMSKERKLKVCFDYVKTYGECNPRIPHYHGMDWVYIYANDMFIDGKGNCFSYAAAFAYMAKAVGYENVYACNSGGHGWTEIDGLVYDPEWSIHNHEYTYYALSYDAQTDVRYKSAISAGLPWMHVKV